MAEVLGTVATILQLVETALRAREYIKDFKNASAEQRKLFSDIGDLKLLLAELEKRAQASPSAGVLQHMLRPLEDFKALLQEFVAKFEQPDNRLAKFTKQLTWTLWNKMEATEFVKKFEAIKSTLNTWLTMGIWDTNQVQERKEEERYNEAEKQQILDWITPLNFFQRQADILAAWQPGTGQWLLSHAQFKCWESQVNQPVQGRQAMVVNYLQTKFQIADSGVACIYLNHKETATQTLVNLLASIWRQLAVAKPLDPSVHALYKHHKERDTRPSVQEITNILQILIAQRQPTLREEIKSCITSKVEGMFLLAKLHIGSLSTKNTVKAVRQALQGLPQDLDQTYEEAIERILSQCSDDKELALRTLTWVAYTKRPLSVAELQEALAIEPGATSLDTDNLLDISIVLAVCAGLVIVDEEMSVDIGDYTAAWNLLDIAATIWGQPVKTNEQGSLVTAAQFGHEKIVRIILEKTVTMGQHMDWKHGFHAALSYGHISVVQGLLDYGADVNADLGGAWGPALQVASESGHMEIVQLLIAYGADVNDNGGPYGTALEAACLNGYIQVAQLLIAHGADVNDNGGPYGTALEAACLNGYIQVAQLLIAHGADVNDNGGPYGTALEAACLNGYIQVAQLLIAHGADVNAKEGYFGTALKAACLNGHIQVAQLLIAHGADVNAKEGYSGTALKAACLNGHIQVVQLLIAHGADVNAKEGHFETALKAACLNGYIQVAQLLIALGADDEGGYYGKAVKAACMSRYIQVAQLLIAHEADVNAQGGKIGSALQAASLGGNIALVQLLLEHGANVNDNGGPYKTALQAASSMGHMQIAQLLIAHGADVNAQGGKFGSALQAASLHGQRVLVQLLSYMEPV
ncbi:ankyrin repeat-containing domain protein [Mycena belliarum]|uniref:Ankyrin repeat-containing domain protein n=1 Tax=Mycena belliarum TaxID=1033014 RepID=A0AAD6TYW7_9AGAR|nr:ankyrin repeat-containing domain protein [Mycena belliae]